MVAPHLSTGGMPQYLVKQIEVLSNEYDIYCVEWGDVTGGIYVVQRNRVIDMLGDKFYSLTEDKSVFIDIINDIEPSMIHFQEVPETFINSDILDIIYSNDRDYSIVVTTHSSLTDPSCIKYTADRFILVSEWSKDIFDNYYKNEIDCTVWEYPIEKINYDKIDAKRELGWDLDYKHILNVGLFTSGKNQGELFELAKHFLDEKVLFHFVGNQAVNFKEYWESIMLNKPSNCIIHGERDDVDKFYKASDIFYFTSNFELSPLVVRESLSYGLPTFIKKLHTYKDMYDGLVTYITGDVYKNKTNVMDILYKNGNRYDYV